MRRGRNSRTYRSSARACRTPSTARLAFKPTDRPRMQIPYTMQCVQSVGRLSSGWLAAPPLVATTPEPPPHPQPAPPRYHPAFVLLPTLATQIAIANIRSWAKRAGAHQATPMYLTRCKVISRMRPLMELDLACPSIAQLIVCGSKQAPFSSWNHSGEEFRKPPTMS